MQNSFYGLKKPPEIVEYDITQSMLDILKRFKGKEFVKICGRERRLARGLIKRKLAYCIIKTSNEFELTIRGEKLLEIIIKLKL